MLAQWRRRQLKAVWAGVGGWRLAEQYNAVLVQALAFVAQASFILFYRLVYARFAAFCQRPLLGWWLEVQLRCVNIVCFYPSGAVRRPPSTASTVALRIR